MTAASSNGALGQMLNEGLIYDATTSSGLTNHLPMALVAKAALGAGPTELVRFANKYRSRLVAVNEPVERLTNVTWRRALGERSAYADLQDYFNREIGECGVEETLRGHLHHLVEGVSGAAFHGVIRLAYALDSGELRRVGSGLAYLASSFITLGPLERDSLRSDDPELLFGELAKDHHRSSLTPARTISEEMKRAASNPLFSRVVSSLKIDDDTPRRLAHVALKVYASTDDFTALHGVTGLEALSKIRPYVEDRERLDRASFQALTAAYLSIGAPSVWSAARLDDMVASTKLDGVTVRATAAMSDDAHVAKIVFTSSRRLVESGEPLYAAVAERAVKNDRSVKGLVNEVEC
ncbi:MAG: questin oxidase family protein [Acidimicrobiales bacterium]